MIQALLVTDDDEVANHFYLLANGAEIDGVRFRLCPRSRAEVLPKEQYDLVVTDLGVINDKPHIIWSCDPFDAPRRVPVFVTRPTPGCRHQPYYVPTLPTAGSLIGYADEAGWVAAIRSEVSWEKFTRVASLDDIRKCKILILNGPLLRDDLVFAVCRAWGVQIVCEATAVADAAIDVVCDGSDQRWIQGVKMSIKKTQARANADALVRAGMKYSNIAPLAGAAKQLLADQNKTVASARTAPMSDPLGERQQSTMVKRITRPRSAALPPPESRQKPKRVFGAIQMEAYTAPLVTPMKLPPWFANDGPVDVSVVVPMFRCADVIGDLVKSWDIESESPPHESIFVSDCCPQHAHQDLIRAWESRRPCPPIGKVIVFDRHCGFATACNEGAREARGQFIVFLNSDTILTPNWLKPLVQPLIDDPEVGIVGNLQLKMDGTIDSAGSEWSPVSRSFEHIGRNIWRGKRLTRSMTVSEAPPEMLQDSVRQMVTGCCVAMRREFFEQIGGFDVAYRIGYWEDADLCMRVWDAGKKVHFTSKSVIYHRGGHSKASGHPYMLDNARLFYHKWVNNRRFDTWINL